MPGFEVPAYLRSESSWEVFRQVGRSGGGGVRSIQGGVGFGAVGAGSGQIECEEAAIERTCASGETGVFRLHREGEQVYLAGRGLTHLGRAEVG